MTPGELAQLIAPLKPLPKPHFWYAESSEWIQYPDDAAALARVCGTACLRGEDVTAPQLQAALRTGLPLGVMWSPWHNELPEGIAPDPQSIGITRLVDAEKTLAGKVNRLVGLLLQTLGGNRAKWPAITHVIDCEMWPVLRRQARLDAANRMRTWSFLLQNYLPGDQIWYCCGRCHKQHYERELTSYNAELLPGIQHCTCNLYSLPYGDLARDTLRWTRDYARMHAIPYVVPFVALGAGYRASVTTLNGVHPALGGYWDFNWDMEAWVPWRWGAELCFDGYADPLRYVGNADIPSVVFYPSILDPRANYVRRDFVRYCEGAAFQIPAEMKASARPVASYAEARAMMQEIDARFTANDPRDVREVIEYP